MSEIANIRTGKADTKMSAPSHVEGVREGNQRGALRHMPGMRREGRKLVVDARRSTGINAGHRDPIDPGMPTLSPA